MCVRAGRGIGVPVYAAVRVRGTRAAACVCACVFLCACGFKGFREFEREGFALFQEMTAPAWRELTDGIAARGGAHLLSQL